MKKNKNIKALAIGFFLIAIVGMTVYFRTVKKEAALQSELLAISEEKNKEQAAKKITAAELLKKIQDSEDINIVDIRSRDEYLKEHILDSKNIPVSEIGAKIAGLDKNKKYVFLDDGLVSDAANLTLDILSKGGFEDAYYLDGGFFVWKKNYGPTISSGDPDSFVDRAKVRYATSEWLHSAQAGVFIIDVRTAIQFSAEHIKGARNIPLDSLEERRGEISLGKKIIVYGDEKMGAFQGVVRLFDMGFLNIAALEGGLSGWKQKGFETEK